jgi:uncharacterized protein YkwD
MSERAWQDPSVASLCLRPSDQRRPTSLYERSGRSVPTREAARCRRDFPASTDFCYTTLASLIRGSKSAVRRPIAPALCLIVFAVTATTTEDPSVGVRQIFLKGINAGRHEAPPLHLSEVLSRVAQTRAEELARADRNPQQASVAEVSRPAAQAGYDARFLSEVFLWSEGDIDTVLSEAASGDGPLAQEIARAELQDLGVGIARREEVPFYVLLFGLNWQDRLSAKRLEFGDLSRVRRELRERINRERASRRLPPLRPAPSLDAAAQAHAADMLSRSYYGHNSPEGATVLERSKRAGYQPRLVGENLAQGQESIDQVVEAWMTSAIHREHILSPVFSDLGSGVAIGTNANGHQILWVQCFGRPKE